MDAKEAGEGQINVSKKKKKNYGSCIPHYALPGKEKEPPGLPSAKNRRELLNKTSKRPINKS